MTLRIKVAPDGASLIVFCDECRETVQDLGEYPSLTDVDKAIRENNPACSWPNRWGPNPQAQVDDSGES